MKKTLGAIIAVLMITAMLAMSVFAYTDTYPVSGDGAEGELLMGELFGGGSWDNNPDVSYDAAWDGNLDTFYDPASADDESYTGVKLSEAYILTEIRIHPRSTDFLNRYEGAAIQGSDDGENWTTVFISEAVAENLEFQIIKPAGFIAGTNTGYVYYRYINIGLNADGNRIHGDVAEVELYGEVKNKPVVEEVVEVPAAVEAPVAVAPAVVTAPQTNDNFVLAVSLMLAAFIAVFVVMRKRVAR